MIFWISKLISGVTGWDISVVQKRVLLFTFILGFIAVICLGLFLRSCFHREPKIDLKTVDKINKANEADRLKELRKTIEENSDVVKTVDNRTTIAETNVIERNKEIDAKVQAADKKVQEAKSQGRDVTQEELNCLLAGECE